MCVSVYTGIAAFGGKCRWRVACTAAEAGLRERRSLEFSAITRKGCAWSVCSRGAAHELKPITRLTRRTRCAMTVTPDPRHRWDTLVHFVLQISDWQLSAAKALATTEILTGITSLGNSEGHISVTHPLLQVPERTGVTQRRPHFRDFTPSCPSSRLYDRCIHPPLLPPRRGCRSGRDPLRPAGTSGH
jgi:hypothetical protein